MSRQNPLSDSLRLPQSDGPSPGTLARRKLQWMSSILERIQHCVVPDALVRVVELQNEIKGFEVKVSLVGQVKAGKTALTNSLINKPDMLPSDVNPWTSVITSVHINTPKPGDHRAVFTFFTKEDWDSMVNVGGRLGEAAQRANFDEEFAEVRSQIQLMQANAERRLGKNFKYLLGSSHKFSGYHSELIKRYVCLGDDDDSKVSPEGRFADLTKSADIYIDDPHYPLPTTIRDTPGVNDPFLVRETVTLDNLSDSDICIIVLSAHQTFTTVDIALVRILMTLRHEQIILFINRIDELSDPDSQIEEIDSYVRATLVEQGLPRDLPIVFGSALWAMAASFGLTEGALGKGEETLKKLADSRNKKSARSGDDLGALLEKTANSTHRKVHDLSGLGELLRVIETKSVQAVGQPLVEKLQKKAFEICQQSSVLLRQTLDNAAPIRADLDVNRLIDGLDLMLRQVDDECRGVTSKCGEQMLFDMSSAYRTFIAEETNAINSVLDNGGMTADWTADTEKLRRELNRAYQAFDRTGRAEIQKIFAGATQKVAEFYANILEADSQLFAVQEPVVTPARIPTPLMQSMTIDITTGWFENWFLKKKTKSAFIKRFESIVEDEMRSTIKDMQEIYIADFVRTTRMQLHDFLSGHIQTLQNLSVLDSSQQKSEMRRKLGLDTEIRNRLMAIAEIEAELAAGFGVSEGAR